MAFVYILRCAGGSLYTGVTLDLDRRLAQHGAGRASRYTRARLPVTMVWWREVESWGGALQEEARIKRLPRAAKETLANSGQPALLFSPTMTTSDSLFLRACRNQPVERPPVWIMRQAGRYLPAYRAVRDRVDFLTLCKTPELAAEVTVQPVEYLGVDAAILFADILLPLEAMGARLVFTPGDGPTFPEPIRRREDIARLRQPDVERDLGYVFAAMGEVRRRLRLLRPEAPVPVIGFGGTPWTLAAYLVEGGGSKHFGHLLAWSYADPAGLASLLERIAETSVEYLLGQIEAGAQAIQLFDTWGGLLDEERYQRLALPPLLRVIEALSGKVPLLFFSQGTSHLLPTLRTLPVEVLSVDWRLPLGQVREIVGPDKVLQGNLDPGVLLAPPAEIERATAALLAAGRGGGHIVNLGHGILPQTPPEHARLFVETVKRLGAAPNYLPPHGVPGAGHTAG